MGWALFILTVLIVSLLGASNYGETANKPLWIAGVVPALGSAVLLFAIVGANTPSHQWGQAMEIVGGYLIMGPIVLGGISYWTAYRARDAKPPTYLKDDFR